MGMSDVLNMYQKKFGTKEKKQFAPQQMNPTTQENLAIAALAKMKKIDPATAESLKVPTLAKRVSGGDKMTLPDVMKALDAIAVAKQDADSGRVSPLLPIKMRRDLENAYGIKSMPKQDFEKMVKVPSPDEIAARQKPAAQPPPVHVSEVADTIQLKAGDPQSAALWNAAKPGTWFRKPNGKPVMKQ